MNPLTYKDAGVDIDAGNALVERIKPLAKATARAGALGGLGGFGAIFDLKAAGFKDPLLISSTDGVGTKLKIAQTTGHHSSIGIDLVAMCVNDLIVQGAEPLFFLDYFATGKLSVETAAQVVAGIAEGCKQAGCALVGGETAEMPSMYAPGDYDLAGFSVGAVERAELLPRNTICEGDAIIGLASSGLHSNGFSLVRHIIEKQGLTYNSPAPFSPGQTLSQALLIPTRIYVKSCLAAISHAGDAVKALAHITGGGLLENIPRVLPADLGATLYAKNWAQPPVFSWLQDASEIQPIEMQRTFNCGIGMALVASATAADAILSILTDMGEDAYIIGAITPRTDSAVVIHA